MPSKNVPSGFTVLTPYLFIENAHEFSQFLSVAFDAQEVVKSLNDDGTIANLQMKIDDSMIMISEASEAYPAMTTSFYLYVEEADDAMDKALAAGATLEMQVMDMPYGDRQGGVRDLWGNIWWISQRLISSLH